jgi:hypothetical protein
MSEELKPCPFCNGEAGFVEDHDTGRISGNGVWFVGCMNCLARSLGASSHHIGVADAKKFCAISWNRRPAPQSAPATATGDERDAFEANYAKVWRAYEGYDFPRFNDGTYQAPSIEGAWLLWQASAAHRREDQRVPWWNECGYQTLFNAIAAATDAPCKGTVGVSVIKFRNYLDGVTAMQRTAAPSQTDTEE